MLRNFLVLESDILVAQDIGEMLAAASPGATVHHATSVEEALEHVQSLASLDLAVLHVSNGRLKASGLDTRITQLGGDILLLGGDEQPAAETPSKWQRIDLPFTSAMIIDAVERMGLKS